MHEKINRIPFKGMIEFLFIKRNKYHLGRWSYISKEQTIDRIDRSNIDHCGKSYYKHKKEIKKNKEIIL